VKKVVEFASSIIYVMWWTRNQSWFRRGL